MATKVRERRLSTSAPISDLKGPVGPSFSRPKHKRTATGFGPKEIKSVEAAIPEGQRAVYVEQIPFYSRFLVLPTKLALLFGP